MHAVPVPIGTDPEAPWVRPAHVADADAMGELQVRAWQEGYRGLVPQAYLDGLDAGERRAFWRQMLTDPPPGGRMLVACRDAAVVGFVAYGPDETEHPPGRGRLYAINVEPRQWGGGAGSALLVAAQELLAADGFTDAVLWVLPGNARARRLFERFGWRTEFLQRPTEVLGATVTELRYRRALP